MKKISIIILLLSSFVFGQNLKLGEARGLFFGLGIGPRVPLGDFANNQNIGIGFDLTLAYTDNVLVPVFIYSKLGYQHFPGDQTYYKKSDYSAFSSDVIVANLGVRYYLPPLIENIVIIMPVFEAGVSYAYYEKVHEFKIDSGRRSYTEESSKTGLHVGVGVSMFLLDVIGYYNYLHNHQYMSLDLRIQIPIFLEM
ncbi:MAG: hypothetical protein JEY94_13300 [Melioribacteraceae bacterium]|nr:hypothetical protein [Melioribacteraceae bacterium]